MSRAKWWLTIGMAGSLLLGFSIAANAQFGGLKKRVKQKVEDKAVEKTGQAIDKATSGEQEKPADSAATTPATTQTGGAATDKGTTATSGGSSGQKPGEGVWVKYDFVPGDRVIFFDDLTKDEVGNFPQRLELEKGNMEVAEWNGSRWLRAVTECKFSVPLPEVLPERFSMEFDFYAPTQWPEVQVACMTEKQTYEDPTLCEAFFSTYSGTSAGIRRASSNEVVSATRMPEGTDKAVMHCQIMADGKYMKVYVNDTRVANFPNTNFGRSNKIYIRNTAATDRPVMFANFRIAAGGKKIYDALMASGRVATQGILFDSGSDRVRPESTPTLKEISQMMKDHADLKVLVEGHTDNTGDKASNQTLSEKRAAAVREALTSQFGIDGARLESKGFGDTKPVSSNDTPEGRQNNRRVELVKM